MGDHQDLRAALCDHLDPSIPPRGLPMVAYRSDDLYAREVERVFRRSWLMIGPSAEFAAPGSYVAVDIAGEPIIVVRDGDGQLHALSRLCRHRGLPLVAEGCGTLDRFVCGYHRWSYRLDGSLIGAPLMDDVAGFDRASCRLPSIRVEEWQGFVFVNLDPDAAPLRPRLSGVEEGLAHYDLADSVTLANCDEVWEMNWKLGVENSSESYHHPGVHAATVGPSAPPSGSWIEPGTDDWALHRTKLTETGRTPDFDALLPLDDDDLRALRCYTIFPSTVLLTSGSLVNWLTYLPVSAMQTRLRAGLNFPGALRADAAELREAIQPGFDQVNAEDRAIVTAMQRASGSRLAEPGVLSATEGVLVELYRFLARALEVA